MSFQLSEATRQAMMQQYLQQNTKRDRAGRLVELNSTLRIYDGYGVLLACLTVICGPAVGGSLQFAAEGIVKRTGTPVNYEVVNGAGESWLYGVVGNGLSFTTDHLIEGGHLAVSGTLRVGSETADE